MHVDRIKPGPGQESAWDYPRPPVIQATDRHITVTFAGTVIADTTRALRVLETSHPPVYYIPLADVAPGVLSASGRASYCEFKGEATYHDVRVGGQTAAGGAWTYERPTSGYEQLVGHAAFYAHLMDECTVDGVRVRAQSGGFYGGWITPDVVGPFKGEPGTSGW